MIMICDNNFAEPVLCVVDVMQLFRCERTNREETIAATRAGRPRSATAEVKLGLGERPHEHVYVEKYPLGTAPIAARWRPATQTSDSHITVIVNAPHLDNRSTVFEA